MQESDVNVLSLFFPDVDWTKVSWTFIHFSRQDYAKTVPCPAEDMVTVELEHSDGGCLCELSFRWHLLDKKLSPELTCFGDALPMLLTPTFSRLLWLLSDLKNPNYTTDDLADILLNLGAVDRSDQPRSDQAQKEAPEA